MQSIILDFSDTGLAELDAIVELAHEKGRKETISTALALYKWYLELEKQGGHILVSSADKSNKPPVRINFKFED